MSYILDALKKADQERTLGSVPDLETPHWGVRRPARNYRWFWIAAALLLVNGVLLALLLGRGTGDDEPPAIDEPSALSAPFVPVKPVTPVPGAGTTVVTRPRSMILPPPPPPPAQSVAVTQPAVPAAEPGAAPSPAPQAAPVRPRQQGVQLWSDLPLEFRAAFQLPHIDVHVYADQPARRFILVDLQKYREGDTLESGAVIEEILPQGLQLYYQGTRFEIEK